MIGGAGAAVIARALRQRPCREQVNKLDLREQRPGFEIPAFGAVALAGMLVEDDQGHGPSALKKLNLSGNQIGGRKRDGRVTFEGPDAIARALRSNGSLKDLDLSSNFIRDQGASCFKGVFVARAGGRSTLTQLVLSDNGVSEHVRRELQRELPFALVCTDHHQPGI